MSESGDAGLALVAFCACAGFAVRCGVLANGVCTACKGELSFFANEAARWSRGRKLELRLAGQELVDTCC